MPDKNIEEYLDYTLERLRKKYSEESPENMFYEDRTYEMFISNMRRLLQNPEEFKKRYCEVNSIGSRDNKVCEWPGKQLYKKLVW